MKASAGVVAHTWGVEIKLEATGLRSGSPYAVVVMTRDRRPRSAGAFVGTGDNVMNCNLNSDVLRPDATGFRACLMKRAKQFSPRICRPPVFASDRGSPAAP